MKIEVKGNANFCLEIKEPRYKTYGIQGEWGHDHRSNSIIWLCDNERIGVTSGVELISLCNRLQGCEYSEVFEILETQKVVIPPYTNGNRPASIQELDLIKSVANVFLWIEYLLYEDYDLSMEMDYLPKLYDDFKIDINNKPTSQRDIYFLKREYSENKYGKLIKKLIDINLLDSLKVSTRGGEINNYFIPFTKPGYSLEIFGNQENYSFWKTILGDRNRAIKNHFSKF